MPKEILLYGEIDCTSAIAFIEGVNELPEGSDLNLRVNTEGGNPEYGWGMAAKFHEFTGPKRVKVDGQAASMGLFFLCYADKVEGLDVSEYLLHRAAYSEWVEKSEYFSDPMRENLIRVNKSLQAAIESKIDVKKFEELKGVKLKDIFSLDSRIDVFLSAKEAKQIGLIDKIIKLTPEKRSEIEAFAKAAKYTGKLPEVKKEDKKENENLNIMTKEELKSKHPEVYASILNEGVEQEKDRIEACLVYQGDINPVIKAAIESGKPLKEKEKSELQMEAMKRITSNSLKEGSASASQTQTGEEDKTVKTDKAKKMASYEEEIRKNLTKKG